MLASRERPLSQRTTRFIGRYKRSIAIGVLKGLLVLITVALCVSELLHPSSVLSARLAVVFVIAFFVVSIVYLLFVSSRVRFDVPGVDERVMGFSGDKVSDGEGASDDVDADAIERSSTSARDEADSHEAGMLARVRSWMDGRVFRRGGWQSFEGTIQVPRLKAGAAHVTIVNDSPLPVLRAEASFEIVHAGEGEDAFDEHDPEIVEGDAFSIPARSSRPAAVANTFNHVGVFLMRSRGIRIHDLIGLCSRVCGPRGQWRVRVVPNIYRLTRGIPENLKVNQASLGIPKAPSDALDYDRVRDYQPGDPLKIIHWKIVAHGQGELYTKLFETATQTDATLLVDPFGLSSRGDSPDIARHLYDTMLEGGFSLMENAREHGISGRVRFMSRNESLSQMRWEGAATLGLFVEMAKPPAQTQDAAMQSMLSIRSLLDGRAGYVIFATSHLTRESVGRLIECHNAGVPLLVVHALPRDTHSEFSRQLSYDDQLWQNSIGVISLKDGPQIVKEVAAQ